MEKVAPKKKVGRPKKSPTIPPTKFKGVGTAKDPVLPTQCGVVEWTYTEIKSFNNIMKTLKSCEVEVMRLHFLRKKIIIEGVINQYAKTSKIERQTRVVIDATDTYSYYVKDPIGFTINMTEWNASLEDMDESCNEFTLIYRESEYLNVVIKNVSVVCSITNDIKIEKVEKNYTNNNLISSALSDNVAKISNVKASNLKSFLGKNSRKTAQESTFQLQGNNCNFNFKLASERNQRVTLDVYSESAVNNIIKQNNKNGSKPKDQFYVISKIDDIYDIKFPNIEIHKFLLHMKNDMIEIYFGMDSVVVQVIKPRVVITDKMTDDDIAMLGPHSTFVYYIPLSNRS